MKLSVVLLLVFLLGILANAEILKKRTWNHPAPTNYGNDEFMYLVNMRTIRDTLMNPYRQGQALAGQAPTWISRGLPNVISLYDSNAPEFTSWQGTTVRLGVNQVSLTGTLARDWRFDVNTKKYARVLNGRVTSNTAIGFYKGIPATPVTYTWTNRPGYQGAFGSILRDRGYTDSIEEISRMLSQPTGMPGGGTIAQELANNADPVISGLFDEIRDLTLKVVIGRYTGVNPNLLRVTATNNMVFDANGFQAQASATDNDASHAAALVPWLKVGRILWTARPGPRPNPYTACMHITKRADEACTPAFDGVIGDDTLGETEAPDEVIKNAQQITLLYAKAITNNPKILRNYNGEGTSSDPDDGTELSPDEMYEGATTQDEADIGIENAINDKLDGDPDNMDRDLFAKFVVLFRKDVRMRIANLKARATTLGWSSDKHITAEAKANMAQRMEQKYRDTYGRPSEKDNSDISQDDTEGEGSYEPANVPFYDYRPNEIIKSVNEIDALDIAAELFPELVTTSENVRTTEEGDEQVIDTTHMVEGTVEYAKVWTKLAPAIKSLLKTTNLPKWKYDRVKAMLDKTGKALQARNGGLFDKANGGMEIGDLEINDRDAIEGFHGDIYGEAVGVDIDTLDDTETVPDLEWAPTPDLLTETPISTVRTPQTGNPSLYRSKPIAMKDSTRRTKLPVRSSRFTQRSTGGITKRRR